MSIDGASKLKELNRRYDTSSVVTAFSSGTDTDSQIGQRTSDDKHDTLNNMPYFLSAIHKLSVFELKVKDLQVCQNNFLIKMLD